MLSEVKIEIYLEKGGIIRILGTDEYVHYDSVRPSKFKEMSEDIEPYFIVELGERGNFPCFELVQGKSPDEAIEKIVEAGEDPDYIYGISPVRFNINPSKKRERLNQLVNLSLTGGGTVSFDGVEVTVKGYKDTQRAIRQGLDSLNLLESL